MRKQGCEDKITDVIKNHYQNAEAYIRIEKAGPRFKVKRGVKQGDPLSPNLFTCVLESVFRRLEWEGCGMSVFGKRINNLRFADDIALIAQNITDLQKMTVELFRECEKIGLQPNKLKTKYMSNNPDTQLNIEGTHIEKVDDYVYLGQLVSFEERVEKELRIRKQKAWGKFWAMKGIFKGDMSTRAKIKLLESCVMPVLCYGAQTWALTKSQVAGLKITQRAMERSTVKSR